MITKYCNTCRQTLSVDLFYKNKEKHDGLSHQCKHCEKERRKRWYNNNKAKERQTKNNYKERRNSLQKQRRSMDVIFKLKSQLRSRFYNAIKNNQKTGSAVDDLGCTITEFKSHIESKWQKGMTWDNWTKDGWHIDHIKPLSEFVLSNPEELKKACHYSNLQPLWAKDNLDKRWI